MNWPHFSQLTGPLGELEKQVALFLPKLGAGVLLLAAFWFLSSFLSRIILRLAKKSDAAKQDVIELMAQIVRISLMVFGTVTALGTLGVNVAALVAGLGLTGFALGFAFRDALSNVLAGVLIVMYRPFLRGDHIGVVGFDGEVVGIDLRYTSLRKEDKDYLIPNSTLFTNPISLTRRAPPEAEHPAIQESINLRSQIGLMEPDARPVVP